VEGRGHAATLCGLAPTVHGHLLLQRCQEGGAALLLHIRHTDALAHVVHQLPQKGAEVLRPPYVPRHLRIAWPDSTAVTAIISVAPALEAQIAHLPPLELWIARKISQVFV